MPAKPQRPHNVTVHIKQLFAIPGNPKNRSRSGKHNSKLSDSIAEIGCIQPPVVVDSGAKVAVNKKLVPRYIVCDGHRRRWAYIDQGDDKIEVRVIPCFKGLTPAQTARKVFRHLNTTNKRLSDCDFLEAWLIDPSLVNKAQQKRFQLVLEEFGRPMLYEIIERGESTHTLKRAITVNDRFLRLAPRQGAKRRAQLIRIHRWLRGRVHQVLAIMRGNNPDMSAARLFKHKQRRLRKSLETGRDPIW